MRKATVKSQNVPKSELARRASQSARDKKFARSRGMVETKQPLRNRAKKSAPARFSPGTMLAKTISNPFDYKACIPDGAKGVGCFTLKSFVTIANGGAAGTACSFALGNDPANYTLGDSGNNSTTWTIPAVWTASTSLAAIRNIYLRYRLVSCAIRIHFTGSTMYNSGTVTLCQFAGPINPAQLNGQNNSTSNGLVSTGAMWSKSMALKDCHGEQISWRPEDQEDYQFSNIPGVAGNSNIVPSQTPWLFIGIDGMNVGQTSSVRIEHVSNYEGQFNNLNFAPGLLASKPVEVGWFERSMSALTSVSPYVKYAAPAAMYAMSQAGW